MRNGSRASCVKSREKTVEKEIREAGTKRATQYKAEGVIRSLLDTVPGCRKSPEYLGIKLSTREYKVGLLRGCGDGDRYLPLSRVEGKEFRLNGFVGDSDILRGDLSNQLLVP